VKLHFLGANRQVTGSCYRLDAAGLRVGVDCGMYQERKYLSRNWEPSALDAGSLDLLLLTHAHLDHCGLLPRLVRDGFAGKILTTKPTIELAREVLEDAARIQEEDVRTKQRRHKKSGRKSRHKYEPLYRVADVEPVIERMRAVPYDETIELGPGVEVSFREAGHILGSAMLELTVRHNHTERRIVFSGDMGMPDVPIVRDPTFIEQADHVVLESTYGDRDHERGVGIEEQLAEIVADARARGGHVIIPTFAIERAQQLLLHLGEAIHAGRMPGLPIFLDSPMAIDVTEIFRRYPDFMDEEARRTLESRRLAQAWSWVRFCRTQAESKRINSVQEPSIILASAGMCTGGRVKHHLSWHIGKPETTVLFVGYQAEETLGRQILDGAEEVRIFGRQLPVRARVRQLQGLSAHAGCSDLLEWLGRFERPPRRVLLTHGEEQASDALAEKIRERFGFEVSVPAYREVVELG
jgi:metallo-beta-lactamase family protein